MEDEEKSKKEMLLALGFPPRPIPGSVIDLDKVLERCDFQTNQVSFSVEGTKQYAESLNGRLRSTSEIVWNICG